MWSVDIAEVAKVVPLTDLNSQSTEQSPIKQMSQKLFNIKKDINTHSCFPKVHSIFLKTHQRPRATTSSKYKYNKEELLELYKPSPQLPASFTTYPIITSEEVVIPVALLPPDMQDEVILFLLLLITYLLYQSYSYHQITAIF